MASSWTMLFNGKDLHGWDTFLGPVWRPGLTWETIKEQSATGLNNDIADVFTIVELDGEQVLRISGEIWGGISTHESYENYHLQLKFKWGNTKWYPRDKESDRRDSGLLYHADGTHGEGGGFWLSSQEFQIQEGDCGDYWAVSRAMADIRTERLERVYQFNPQGNLISFGNGLPAGPYCKKYPDNENPHGQWNTLDLYCLNDTSMHVVNGKLTLILENSRERIKGGEVPLTKGKIQLQSESSEIFYKAIRIRPIDILPEFE